MKKLFVLVIMLGLVVASNAQIKEIIFPLNDNGEIEFTEVIECNLTKAQLFSNAKEWIVKNFKDYNRVVQFEDADMGKITMKGLSELKTKLLEDLNFRYERIYYTITIECKDKKFRYKINDIRFESIYWICSTDREVKTNIQPSYHITQANSAVRMVKMLNEQMLSNDIGTGKKAENKKASIQRLMDVENKEIKAHEDFYNEEYSTLYSLGVSIKKALITNDDF